MGQGWVEFFFDILLYYFVNVIIKTLYISSFIVYVIYFTHSDIMTYNAMCKRKNVEP